MTNPDIGSQPEPTIDPGEPEPGGADAVEHDAGAPAPGTEDEPVPHDTDPEHNPSAGAVPGEMKEGEDTSTRATEAGDSGQTHGGTSEEESPA